MCGIAGLTVAPSARIDIQTVAEQMRAKLVHRGPDEDGFLDLPGVSLASRRLSIVGLDDGRQPIANESGTIHKARANFTVVATANAAVPYFAAAPTTELVS